MKVQLNDGCMCDCCWFTCTIEEFEGYRVAGGQLNTHFVCKVFVQEIIGSPTVYEGFEGFVVILELEAELFLMVFVVLLNWTRRERRTKSCGHL